MPAIPEMTRFFKTDGTVMQASLYVFMLTVALGQLLAGPLADHYGRRCITIYAALLFLIGSILSAFSESVSTLIIARMIQAAGACGTYLLCFIIIRDNFSTTVCARLFSILCGINAMVASSAPVIGGFLLDLTQDWHSGFYFLTLLGLLMSFMAFRNIPDYVYPKQESTHLNIFKTTKLILTHLEFRQHALIASVSLLGLYLFCALSPGILISQLHLSATQYGLWFGLNAITVFLTNLVSARLTYSYPLEKIVRWGLLWIIFSCILMISLNLYHVSVIRFMFPMLCLTFGIGLSMGTATALALKDFKQQAGTATALLGACQFGLSGCIGILTAQLNPEPSLLAFPVLCLGTLSLVGIKRSDLKPLINS
nr:multidrug effflux MFS transporter [Legionella antarctica]